MTDPANEPTSNLCSLWRTVGKDIVAGGLGATFGMSFGVPMDLVKVRMQTFPLKYRTPWQTLMVTLKEEGIRGFFRGSLSPLMSQIPINALVFAGESFALRMLIPFQHYWSTSPTSSAHMAVDTDPRPPSVLTMYAAGCLGGFAQCLLLSPTDLIKCKLQVDIQARLGVEMVTPRYRGIIDCMRQTIQQEGFVGLYRGMGVTVLREVPSYGVYFLVYRYVKQLMTDLTIGGAGVSPSWSTILAGGLAGCASWAVIYPADVLKSVIQASPPETKAADLAMLPLARRLFRAHGFRYFYTGLGVTMLRAFPVNAATFYFYELFKQLLY
jgi:solute carrier family 25 carnitine/acylcarnitine transporter 20/29